MTVNLIYVLFVLPCSSAVGELIERGFAYGTVFTVAALVLVATVVVLGGLERAGRLPA